MAKSVLVSLTLLAWIMPFLPQGDSLQFTKQPQSVVLWPLVGGTTLDCRTDSSFTTYTWLYNDVTLDRAVPEFKYRNHVNGSLKLFGVKEYANYRTDLLRFQCVASDDYGTIISNTATVSLAYLDSYPAAARERQVYGIPGNTALLSCPDFGAVNSRPRARVDWYVNGTRLASARSLTLPSGDLQLANYSPADNGRYQCVLHNIMGSHAKDTRFMSPIVTLTTESLTPVLTFQKLPPSRSSQPITATAGEELLIETVATANVKPTISWTRSDNADMPAKRFLRVGEGNLKINPVQKNDSGYYRITARAEGEVSTHFIHLLVQEKPRATITPPQIVKPGAIATLNCTVTNTPYSSLLWYQNGVRMSETMATLTISPVDVQHDGYYQCFVGNSAGVAMATTRLKVEAAPHFVVEPKSDIAVNVTETLRLNCSATGKPLPDIIWFWNGVAMEARSDASDVSTRQFLETEVTLPSGATAIRSTLIISNVQSSATGRYSCFAHNSLGEKRTSAAMIEVQGPPEFRDLSRVQSAVLGKDAVITVPMSGAPKPHVVWKLPTGLGVGATDRVTQRSDNSLHIKNVELKDAGMYRAMVRNAYGTLTADIKLDVLTKPGVLSAKPKQEFVVLGKSFWLACNTTGVPSPNVTWYREDKLITDTCCQGSKYAIETEEVAQIDSGGGVQSAVMQSKLIIPKMEYRDLTSYSCTARSDGGVATETMTISLHGEAVNGRGVGKSGLPVWAIAVIVITVLLLAIAAIGLFCLVKQKKQDRKLIRKLSQPHLATTLSGINLSSNERVVGDGEDTNTLTAKNGDSTRYSSVVMKTLSQPIEPGRGGRKADLKAVQSSPIPADGPQGSGPTYTTPFGPTPGGTTCTPAEPIIIPTSHAGDFKRHTPLTPVPAARSSKRGRTSSNNSDAPLHPPPGTLSDGQARPTPAQRKDSGESKGGRQAQQGRRSFNTHHSIGKIDRVQTEPTHHSFGKDDGDQTGRTSASSWTNSATKPSLSRAQDTASSRQETHFGTAPKTKTPWSEQQSFSHV